MSPSPLPQTLQKPVEQAKPQVDFCILNPPQVFYDSKAGRMDAKYPPCFVDIGCSQFKPEDIHQVGMPPCLDCKHHRKQ